MSARVIVNLLRCLRTGGLSFALAVQRIHAHKRYRGRHVSFVEHPPLSPFKGGVLLWCYSHRRQVKRGAFVVPLQRGTFTVVLLSWTSSEAQGLHGPPSEGGGAEGRGMFRRLR